MNRFKRSIICNLYSVQNKIVSSRTVTTIVLLLMINLLFAAPILDFASDVGYKANVTMLPFYLGSLNYMVAFIPIVIYYFSGVPFLNYSEMYCIVREGKNKWVIKQMIQIIEMSFVFMLMEVIISIFPFIINGEFANEWNEITVTLSLTDTWVEYSTVEVAYSIIETYTPYGAMLAVFFLESLIISFFGLFLFTVSLLTSRVLALSSGFIFEVLVITVFNTREIDNYLVYMSPFSWSDLYIFGKTYNGIFYPNGTPTMQWCVTVLIIAMIFMAIINLIQVNHMNLNYTNEE